MMLMSVQNTPLQSALVWWRGSMGPTKHESL